MNVLPDAVGPVIQRIPEEEARSQVWYSLVVGTHVHVPGVRGPLVVMMLFRSSRAEVQKRAWRQYSSSVPGTRAASKVWRREGMSMPWFLRGGQSM